ncbi:IS3 family transposase, partial [Avibacterium paragallinarum]
EKVIHEYIHYYNNERIQVKLKGLSPVEYRTQSLNEIRI